MMFSYPQGGLSWLTARLGMITSTTAHALMTKARGKGDGLLSKTAETELFRIKAERHLSDDIKADPKPYFDRIAISSKAMEFGKETEAKARELYEFAEDCKVGEIGFATHNTDEALAEYWGDSPDGIVFEKDGTGGCPDGCIEIKCPTSAKWMEYYTRLTRGESLKDIEPRYYWQVCNHLAVLGAKWCDFVIYDPMLAEGYYTQRFTAEALAEDISALTEAVRTAVEWIKSN